MLGNLDLYVLKNLAIHPGMPDILFPKNKEKSEFVRNPEYLCRCVMIFICRLCFSESSSFPSSNHCVYVKNVLLSSRMLILSAPHVFSCLFLLGTQCSAVTRPEGTTG